MPPNATVRRSIRLLPPSSGTQLLPGDLADGSAAGSISLSSFTDNTVGAILALLGISNALPMTNPVGVAPAGGMVVMAGGGVSPTQQWMIAQDRVLDSCPATPLIIAPADPTYPRIDLVCVQAARVPGNDNVTRQVRGLAATRHVSHLSATLVAGGATVPLPSGFTVAPVVDGLSGMGANSGGGVPRPTTITTTNVTITSVKADGTTDATDTRVVNFQVYGNPTGADGIATAEPLSENRPAWEVLAGTPAASPVAPGAPNGWEAFATVLVPAGAAAITSSDITILFPTVQPLVGGTPTSEDTITLPGGRIEKIGHLAVVVPADGSALDVAVAFPTPFPNALFHVFTSIETPFPSPGAGASSQYNSGTLAGFKASIVSAAPGSTVTLHYLAKGS